MFRQIFCDVPAFSLVDPDISSSFVSRIILHFPYFNNSPFGLLLIAIVNAPLFLASSKTLHVKEHYR